MVFVIGRLSSYSPTLRGGINKNLTKHYKGINFRSRTERKNKMKNKTTHNRKGCKCPKGSDIRFCLGNNMTKQKDLREKDYATEYWKKYRDDDKSSPMSSFNSFVKQKVRESQKETIERVRELAKEKVISDCENCGGKGYGKAWFGKGAETHDSYGDRYQPTGSAVFCEGCRNHFEIGREWNGMEIWKVTSEREEHKELRLSHIKRSMTIEEILQSLEAQEEK